MKMIMPYVLITGSYQSIFTWLLNSRGIPDLFWVSVCSVLPSVSLTSVSIALPSLWYVCRTIFVKEKLYSIIEMLPELNITLFKKPKNIYIDIFNLAILITDKWTQNDPSFPVAVPAPCNPHIFPFTEL